MDFKPWRKDALAPTYPDDDEIAWRAFEAYLVQYPTRNLGRLARERRTTLETVQRWRRLYHWDARVAAYDEHMSEIRDEVVEVTSAELARAASQLVQIGSRELGFLRRTQEKIDAAGTLSARDAMRAVDRGIVLAQLLAGKPTERVAQAEPDLSKLTEEEFDALVRIQEKLAG